MLVETKKKKEEKKSQNVQKSYVSGHRSENNTGKIYCFERACGVEYNSCKNDWIYF